MPATSARATVPAAVATVVLAIALGIGFAAPASAASPVSIGSTGYASIGDALAAASSGDTITVAAGTYVENLDVTVPVTLVGAGAGSSVIVSSTSQSPLTLDARADVSGFTIEGQSTVPNTSSPYAPSTVQINAGGAGSTIHGNILANGYQDVYAQGVTGSASHVTTITNNTIRGFHADQGTGIWIASSSYFAVNNNSISDGAPIDGDSVGVNLVCGSSHLTVVSNTISDVGNAVVDIASGSCGSSTDVVIQGNRVSNTSGSALYFGANNLAGVAITANAVQHVGGTTGAIVISGSSMWLAPAGIPISGFSVTRNSISDAPNGISVGAGARLAGDSSVTSSHNELCSSGLALVNATTGGFTIASTDDNLCATKVSQGVVLTRPTTKDGKPTPTATAIERTVTASKPGTDPDGPLALTGDNNTTGTGSTAGGTTPVQSTPTTQLSERQLREAAGFPLWLGIVIGLLVLAVVFFVVFFVIRRRDA